MARTTALPPIPDPESFPLLPRTKQEAKALGQPLYFPGLPCLKRHTAPRMVYASRCLVCVHLAHDKAAARAKDREAVRRLQARKEREEVRRLEAQAKKAKAAAEAKEAARKAREVDRQARAAARKAAKSAATRAANKAAKAPDPGLATTPLPALPEPLGGPPGADEAAPWD